MFFAQNIKVIITYDVVQAWTGYPRGTYHHTAVTPKITMNRPPTSLRQAPNLNGIAHDPAIVKRAIPAKNPKAQSTQHKKKRITSTAAILVVHGMVHPHVTIPPPIHEKLYWDRCKYGLKQTTIFAGIHIDRTPLRTQPKRHSRPTGADLRAACSAPKAKLLSLRVIFGLQTFLLILYVPQSLPGT